MANHTSMNLRNSHGALVLGCYFGLFLSGVVAMQVYLYFKLFTGDRMALKVLVGVIWFLDFFHTIMACNANWMNVILHFGDWDLMDHINWSIAVTVAITATVTFIVHCFFIHRLYLLSKGNKVLTLPLAVLALFRLVVAIVSTTEMIRLASYSAFVKHYAYVFTMGLSTAVALDVLIAMGLTFYLRRSRSSFSSLNEVVDTLILYAIETGMATCVTTIVSLICWVKMPNNLIFLGLHLNISKLYANSLVASLNSRATLRAKKYTSDRDIQLPILFAGTNPTERPRHSQAPTDMKPMTIRIDKTVHTDAPGNIAELEHDGLASQAHYDDSFANDTPKTSAPFIHF